MISAKLVRRVEAVEQLARRRGARLPEEVRAWLGSLSDEQLDAAAATAALLKGRGEDLALPCEAALAALDVEELRALEAIYRKLGRAGLGRCPQCGGPAEHPQGSCRECGKPFTPQGDGRTEKKFCNQVRKARFNHRLRAPRPHVPAPPPRQVPCDWCGATFPERTRGGHVKRFRSKPCKAAWHEEQGHALARLTQASTAAPLEYAGAARD